VRQGLSSLFVPFAMNEATEYINPTKSLEYMAAGKMIVSSAVPDVVANFGGIVSVARSHEEFVDACHRAIEAPDPDAIRRGLEMAAANTWESIVAALENHIIAALPAAARWKQQPKTPIGHGAI